MVLRKITRVENKQLIKNEIDLNFILDSSWKNSY